MSVSGLGCVKTRGDFSSRPGFTPLQRFLADAGRFSPISGVWVALADSGAIDLESLAEARDQLWAEAAHREARGESIILPRELWEFAAVEQQKRVEADGWENVLEDVNGFYFNGRELLASCWLIENILKIPPGQIQSYHYKRLAKAMRALGWEGPTTVSGSLRETAWSGRAFPDWYRGL